MKRTIKLAVVGALVVGATSAFAIENTKVSGDVSMFYGTMQSEAGTYLGNETNLGQGEGAYGDFAINLELTTDLLKGVSAGVKATAITTLGLEDSLFDNTWSNTHSLSSSIGSEFAGGLQIDDAFFVGELWMAGTIFDTTVKAGRQTLDTPLAFTETWGIDENTFEAILLVNKSIPDTTIVFGLVGKSNGSAYSPNSMDGLNMIAGYGVAAQASYVSEGGKFNTFAQDGAMAFGLINNSFEPLTVQLWHYQMPSFAEAYWAQADLNIGGILAGAQYTLISADKFIQGADDDEAFAVMLGYEAKDVFTVKLAYSIVDDEGTVGVANVATGNGNPLHRNGSGAESKLYTEMWWQKGKVSQIGSESYSITVETTVADIDLFAGYYSSSIKVAHGSNINPDAHLKATEMVLTASKSFGPLDTSLAFIIDEEEEEDQDQRYLKKDKVKTIQVYLTYNF